MRTLAVITALGTILFSALVGCNPYDPDLPASPFLCGSPEQERRCPDGYACVPSAGSAGVEYCLSSDGVVPPDAGSTDCADDSPLEPNNMVSNAWQTPVDTIKAFPLAGLAICPSGDKDTYAVNLRTANENLEILVEFDIEGAPLQGAILSKAGVQITNAAALAGSTNKLRAYLPNLPADLYYVQVYGPNSGALTTNNYKVDINVTGP